MHSTGARLSAPVPVGKPWGERDEVPPPATFSEAK